MDAAAGARRLGAEVEDLGPLGQHAQAALHGAGRIEPEAAVAERVGGEIEDAHDPRAPSQLERALARQAQGPGSGEGRGLHPGSRGEGARPKSIAPGERSPPRALTPAPLPSPPTLPHRERVTICRGAPMWAP